jgi:hypothetical protein
VASPVRFLKKSAAVSTTPTFSATAFNSSAGRIASCISTPNCFRAGTTIYVVQTKYIGPSLRSG